MAERHRHVRWVADHHHRPLAVFHRHHRLASGIRAHKGVEHLVIPQAFRIEAPLVAHATAQLVQFSPAQITAVDSQLIVEPITAAQDRTRGQIPV